MKTSSLHQTKQWLKNSESPLAKFLFTQIKAVFNFEIVAPKFLLASSYSIYVFLRNLFSSLTRIFFWTPLFKGRLQKVGRHLNLYGGLPYISGPISIELGDNCRVSGQTTFSGRSCATTAPQLIVGSNIDIGWMTTIAVGTKVVLADNVRIAGRTILAGYPGHPLNPVDRALGMPETDDQVGDIIIEKDVWLATGVSVMANVRIGQGTVVAAGSVVTRDLPAMVLAGGIPARVIRSLTALDIDKSKTAAEGK